MSFQVSDPQIYEFTICFTSQSPISGLSSPQVCNSEIFAHIGMFEVSMAVGVRLRKEVWRNHICLNLILQTYI